jgi:GNAT superfamily N-acetyltransferase
MTGSAPNAGVTTTGVSPASLPTASRSVSPTEELSLRGAPAELGDGTRVRIRPGRRSDGDLLLRGFERLSAESRYRRFLSPMPKLTEMTLRSLTDIDHRDHEAVLALDESGEGIGVARYVRDAGRPQAAEVAVTVVDGWQGRGLGTLLLEAICVRARRGRPHVHGLDARPQRPDDAPARAPGTRAGRRARRRDDRHRGGDSAARRGAAARRRRRPRRPVRRVAALVLGE